MKLNAIPTMGLSDIVDQLHNKDSFTNTCTTKKTNLSSPLVGCKKIHNLHIKEPSYYNHKEEITANELLCGILNFKGYRTIGQLYLNSSNKNLLLSGLLNKSRGFAMDREEVVCR
jgi:hypothetical protein